MNLKFIALIYSFAVTLHGIKQDEDPVTWHFSVKKISEKVFELHMVASILPPWHIYAKDNPSGVVVPTTINFVKNPLIVLSDTLRELGKVVEIHEANIPLRFYMNRVEYIQIVKLKHVVKTSILGNICFMACTNQRCLPPDAKRFDIPLR